MRNKIGTGGTGISLSTFTPPLPAENRENLNETKDKEMPVPPVPNTNAASRETDLLGAKAYRFKLLDQRFAGIKRYFRESSRTAQARPLYETNSDAPDEAKTTRRTGYRRIDLLGARVLREARHKFMLTSRTNTNCRAIRSRFSATKAPQRCRRGPLRKNSALFFVCRVKERAAKPVSTRAMGLGNCVLNLLKFIHAKPHPDNFSQGFAFRLLWSANFASHIKIFSVARQLFLSQSSFCATNIKASHEVTLSLDRVAGTAAGESELTNSLPVRAGASLRESEMKTGTLQARSLAIEATGDFFYNKIKPKIRLSGQWLAKAGFLPGHRVEVLVDQPGVMTLRFVQQAQEVVS